MKHALYAFYILLIVIVMIPKEKLFYSMESILAEEHVFIGGESFSNRFLYLDIDNSEFLFDNQPFATVEQIRISPWILFNQLSLSSISVSPSYHDFFPGKIDKITLSYSLLHPLSLELFSEGDFGHCNGIVDLLNQKIRVVFDATPALRQYPILVYKLHSTKEGLVYESDF